MTCTSGSGPAGPGRGPSPRQLAQHRHGLIEVAGGGAVQPDEPFQPRPQGNDAARSQADPPVHGRAEQVQAVAAFGQLDPEQEPAPGIRDPGARREMLRDAAPFDTTRLHAVRAAEQALASARP